MDKAKQLRDAIATRHLVLVEFYSDHSAHCDWLESVVERYANRASKHIDVIKVNVETDSAVADSYHVGRAPVFLLLLRGKELWRQVGRLTVDELQEVLDEF